MSSSGWRGQTSTVFVALHQRFQVQALSALGHRIKNRLFHRIDGQKIGRPGEEARHHDIEHQPSPQLLGEAGGRNTERARRHGQLALHLHQLVLVQHQSVGLELRRELDKRVLRKQHQNVRAPHVGIANCLVGHDDLGAARAAARLGPEGLDEGCVPAAVDGGGFSNDGTAQDDALAAQTADANFRPSHLGLPRANTRRPELCLDARS